MEKNLKEECRYQRGREGKGAVRWCGREAENKGAREGYGRPAGKDADDTLEKVGGDIFKKCRREAVCVMSRL